MSGIVTPILMLGAMAGGIYLMMHRCDILGFCGGGAAAAVAPAVAAVPPVDPATVIDPATGLTKAQKDAQEEHLKDRGEQGNRDQRLNIEAKQSVPSVKTVQKITKAACGSKLCKDDPGLCASLNCVTKAPKPAKSNDLSNGRCPGNQTLTNCHTVGSTLQCSCHFARAMYTQAETPYGSHYRVFRNRMSYN